MKGFKYQLKNLRRDKLCVVSFLLPVLVGLAISLLSNNSFSSLRETSFYILQNDLSPGAVQWLEANGQVTRFESLAALQSGVNDPATQAIGVLQNGAGLKTLLSGDELTVTRTLATALPQLYAQRSQAFETTLLPAPGGGDDLKALLIAITLLTAMFMGCTFNALSMIGEREDGIAFVNQVLPMTKGEYIAQKIALGFAGAFLSAMLTACACARIPARLLPHLLLVIFLSAFSAALTGLFIGRFASGLMAGIVYIKAVMILFLAPPILIYLAFPPGGLARLASYLLPSSAAFYSLMALLCGSAQDILLELFILLLHCLAGSLVFFALERKKHCGKPT